MTRKRPERFLGLLVVGSFLLFWMATSALGRAAFRSWVSSQPKQPAVEIFTSSPPTPQPTPRQSTGIITAPKIGASYDPAKFCEGESGKDIHHEFDEIDSFRLELTDGCWSGWIYVPKEWHGKFIISDHQGDLASHWISMWQSGAEAVGPYTPDQNWPFPRGGEPPFRLQGHGPVLFYSTVAHVHKKK